ncbi:DNA methyltransferase [Trichormus azollae]|uniref:DNA methyltransferase n=1 Tax=Trichormus azollae TaxID=1164 RepID=UPI00325E23EB
MSTQEVWLDLKDAHNQNIKITGYPTERNVALMKRIIMASSNPPDIVLDAFAGSGTTIAISGKLGRQWY